MHVAYLHYLLASATGLNHVRQFAAAAEQLGHRVDVHGMNLAPSEHDDSTATPLRLRFRQALKQRFSRYLHDPKEFLWNLSYYRNELKTLRASRPDVLLVRLNPQAVSCVFSARKLGLPLVFEVNAPVEEGWLYDRQYKHLRRLQERAMKWRLAQADAVTVVSTALKDHLLNQYRLREDKFTVVPNGADESLFYPGREPDLEFPSDPASPRIGFVGSFQGFHGLELLVGMIDAVSACCPDARFLLVGGGPGADHVAARIGRSDRVVFTGSVSHDRIPGLVASIDIGVMPEALFYGSPLKVMEWMAAGLAIVAPRYDPLEEILEDGREGLLFPPGDLRSLVEKVSTLVRHPELRAKLGEAASARARSSLTWRHNAEKMLQACSCAVQNHQAARG